MVTMILKNIAAYIVKPLTHIFNWSFVTAIILALVTLVYKANDREKLSNYRPISVLPCFSKILEKVMYKRMYKHTWSSCIKLFMV